MSQQHAYARAVEASTGKDYYPDDVAYEFYQAASGVSRATDGAGLAVVTLDGKPSAALVPLDLVEYALRHGWGR